MTGENIVIRLGKGAHSPRRAVQTQKDRPSRIALLVHEGRLRPCLRRAEKRHVTQRQRKEHRLMRRCSSAQTPQEPHTRIGAELDVRQKQLDHVTEQFRHGRTPLQVIEVVRHANVVADEAFEVALKETPPNAPAVCQQGCAWCCYTPVGTAAPEVLRIVAYLRETLSPELWKGFCERVRSGAQHRQTLGLAQVRRSALPCPLLVDDRCSAYPVRPLTCRGYSSSDSHSCKQSLETDGGVRVPIYWPQQRLSAFVLDGLRAGLEESLLDGELLELTAALRIALDTTDVEDRWLGGESVFSSARLD
jgi:Fe-S-cluster containining protein